MAKIMRQKNALGLRKTGPSAYTGWLGNLRVLVTDENIVSTDPVNILNRLTYSYESFDYSISLPANITLLEDPNDPAQLIATADSDYLLMIAEQCQIINSADGTITDIDIPSEPDDTITQIYPFTSCNPNNSTILNTLEGVILNSYFAGVIPEEFEYTVYGSIVGLSVDVDGVDTIGVAPEEVIVGGNVVPAISITDVYVVSSEIEMLALVIQQGDVVIRTDESKTYINTDGNNISITDWQEVLTPLGNVASVNGQTGVIVLTTTEITEGTNLYFTNERVNENATVMANTSHRNTIVGNPHNVTKTDVGLSDLQNVDLVPAVTLNTAKVGITPSQTTNIVANTSHRNVTTGNPHNVTKAEVGLGSVPNTDFTAEVNANTAKVSITVQQASDIDDNTTHRGTTTGNPHVVNQSDVGLSEVPNTDATALIQANTDHRNITVGNPHQVTKVEIGLSNVPNTNFTADVASSNLHISTTTGNPHQVTKADVGLSNVQNIDTTNASNITTGILPTSVLPPLAITDTFVVADEAAMLVLTVQKGDVAIRTDESKTYINQSGSNTTMSDWVEMQVAGGSSVLSVNNQTGVVVLTTSDITEGTNLYYTEARVSANVSVQANTAHRAIIDGNPHQVTKAEVGLSAVPNVDFTTEVNLNTAKVGITSQQAADILANNIKVGITAQQSNDIVANNTHRDVVSGNPHQVTKTEVGLSNVPNTDFTTAVSSNTNHRNVIGNPHGLTKTDIGLGDVPNTDFTASVALATNHIGIITGNPHAVTKAEVGLGNVPNTDFTTAVSSNTAHANVVAGNPHNVTKTEVGLSNVPNVDLSGAVALNSGHRGTVGGNPHGVTKTEVGLSNVQNIDTTDASNITSGTLPTSVLPPLAITDTHVVADEAAMLVLTVQKGDVAIRTDLEISYINQSGSNTAMSDWAELLNAGGSSVLSVNNQTGVVVLTTSDITEGANLYYTDARVSANVDVVASKDHLNTTTGNPHGVTKVDVGLGSVPDTDFTAAVAANTDHSAVTTGNPHQVTKTDLNLDNVPNIDFTTPVASNTAHSAVTTGNPHQVTKAEIGLGSVPNTDFTTPVAANTAHSAVTTGNPHAVTKTEVGLSDVPNTDFTVDVTANKTHRLLLSGNPHNVTSADLNLDNVPNTDFTADVNAANSHRAIITGNPHQVTKTEVGLSNVPNVDFSAAVADNANHTATTTGNPHQVTKADVGLSNVQNIDTTNASNITTGILPTSVLPPLAITDTHVVADETAMLALVVQKGDVAIRTDLELSFVNQSGSNTAMTDWAELLNVGGSTVMSVNGQTGVVVLTTANITEGSNLYYTEARVSANVDVVANSLHRNIIAGNPHGITPTMIGTIDEVTIQTRIDLAFDNAKLHLFDKVKWFSSPTAYRLHKDNDVHSQLMRYCTYWCEVQAWHHDETIDNIDIGMSTVVSGITITKVSDNLFKVVLADIVMINDTIDVIFTISCGFDGLVVTKDIVVPIIKDMVQLASAGLQSDEFMYGVAVDPNDNDIVTVGYTRSEGVGRRDAMVIRMDNQLHPVFKRIYGGTGDEYFRDVVIDTDGNIYACGYTNSDGEGNYEAMVIKLDKDLNLLGKVMLGDGDNEYFYGIAVSDTTVYACGYTNSDGEGNYDALIMSISKNFDLLTVKQYVYGHGGNDRFYGICIDPFGEIICCGYTAAGAGQNALIVKFDANLNLVDEILYGTNATEVGYAVTTDTSGNIYVAGYTNKTHEDSYLIKVNTSFVVVGTVALDHSSKNRFYGVTTLTTDEIVCVGYTSTGSLKKDGIIAKFDPSLTLQEIEILSGDDDDILEAITSDNLDNLVVVGSTKSEGQSAADGVCMRWYGNDAFISGSFGCVELPGVVVSDIGIPTRAVSDGIVNYTFAYNPSTLSVGIPKLTIQDSNVTVISGIVY